MMAALVGCRVAVLHGGHSPEREVSLQSGAIVLAALNSLGIDHLPIDTAEKQWWKNLKEGDIAFICLHGSDGEGGIIQGFLQTLGIAYTGSGVAASSLAMDKVRSKQLWAGIGLPTAPFEKLEAHTNWAELADRWGHAFVKPCHGGSSIGMTKVANEYELEAAYRVASEFDDEVIAEKYIAGAEYTVSVLGDRALPTIRMETDHEFYDYEAKYVSDETRYLCPCGLEKEVEFSISQLAQSAFQSLGCEVWGRVDFIKGSDDSFYILEVNTVPGMTSHSLVPMAAKHAELSIEQLVEDILILSLSEKGNKI
jgi:D-alanine-D-alanine ligase